MAHKMGLAYVTLGSRQIATTRWYNLAETSYEDSSEKTTIVASANFETNIPFTSAPGYLYLVNPNKTTLLKTPDSDSRKWILALNTQIVAGSYKNFTATPSKSDFIYKGWKISYANSTQTFNKAAKAGKYKLEVFGAQGGDGYEWNETAADRIVQGAGGKGGYTFGTATLTANQKLYICTGGKGTVAGRTANVRATGGYNGGGAGGTEQSETVPESASGGGGATHIATDAGAGSSYLLTAYSASSNQSKVLIVAGGGGGASGTFPVGWVSSGGTMTPTGEWTIYGLTTANLYGGAGGSVGAGSATNGSTTGGVASGGNTTYFGKGQDGFVGTSSNKGGIGGGGGGWFGGTCTSNYTNSLASGGAGGSGHVHSSLEIPGGTVGYNSGNGWARISSTFEW